MTYKKNLIIGSIKKYKWNKIKFFFNSFEKAKFENCDIVMFINNIEQSTINQIKAYGVIIYEIPYKYNNMRVNNYRFKLYADFLLDKLDIYNMIFLTDVRDVIFQKDVFKYYDKFKNFLGLAIEDNNISQPINQKWIISAFGKKLYNKLKDKPIICSGTILGTSEIIYKFCNIIWEKIKSSNIPLPFNLRHDQTIVNYIIYHSKMLKDFIIESNNNNGTIMTIGYTLGNISLDSENNILNRKGEIAAVIHQYDRKLNIMKILLKKYNLRNIKNTKNYNKIIFIIISINFFIIVFILKKQRRKSKNLKVFFI